RPLRGSVAEDKPRQALAFKVEAQDGKAKVTVAFNYTGKPGDKPTFVGVRLYSYDVPMGKGPTRVGWEGKEGRQTVVLAGQKYTNVPARVARQENGSLAVAAAAGGKVRLRGVDHACGRLFVVGETVRPGDRVLVRAGNALLE